MTDMQSTNLQLKHKNDQLWHDYQTKKADNRMLFPTEGAQALGISEFELLLASPYSQYMGTACQEVLASFNAFGKLESITRNDYAVHEKSGSYNNLKISERMGLMVNVGGLDLRYFIKKWKHMLAIEDNSNPERVIYSIQFFDGQGNAVNKVYLKDIDKLDDWRALIAEQVNKLVIDTLETDTLELEVIEPLEDWQLKELNAEDKQSLHSQWQAMTDIHQFFGILSGLDIDRASSYQQAPEGMTFALKPTALQPLLERVRDDACPVLTFVGNTGVVQIQTGTMQTIKRMGDWLNVLDKSHNDFTLHLKDSAVAQLWCVKRPTEDGIVTCIEAFDNKGRTIVTFFGKRQEGEKELDSWRAITDWMIAEHKL